MTVFPSGCVAELIDAEQPGSQGLMVLCLSAVRNAAQTDIGHTEPDRRRWR
jgi:hypothetical protein